MIPFIKLAENPPDSIAGGDINLNEFRNLGMVQAMLDGANKTVWSMSQPEINASNELIEGKSQTPIQIGSVAALPSGDPVVIEVQRVPAVVKFAVIGAVAFFGYKYFFKKGKK